MQALMLVIQLASVAPEYNYHLGQVERPYQNVTSEQLVAQIDAYADRDRTVLAKSQIDELTGMEKELASRTYGK